ncbi:MAG TPA: gamma-glutamyltransferase [Gemmatimonadetes bacterium]|nr:gamma-glutamyltransferase [Gemmatimonadota bacterium]
MLKSVLQRPGRTVLALLPCLFSSVGLQQASAQEDEGFPYETLRSPVSGLRGVVATSQPLASNAGLDILRAGGNAIDAAVATAAVLTVVEPHSTSLGGDAFIMVYLAAEKKLIGLNASGRAPYAMTLDALNEKLDKHDMNRIRGIYSVTVPGAVDGWFEVLEKYGTMSMAEVLAPAIHYAENGFPVSPIIAGAWRGLERNQEPSTRGTWLIDGERAPRAGEVFRNPDLANTFRMLAAQGRDAFYRGPLAETMVAYSNEHDGFFTMKDFADHTSTWVEPLYADYQNYRLYELPPNGQGIAALEMVKILGNVDLGAMGHNSAEYLHHVIEAKKLAYADIDKWNSDPEFNDLPIQEMISTEYARGQFQRIDPTRAMERPESGLNGDGDTILLEVMDADHNAVSFIYSLFSSFGSGLVPPGTGFTLQNRGGLFSREPGHANVVEPHKRPFHTIIPAMAFKDGEFFMTFGAMGGSVQPQQHVQIFLNVVEFGMNMQQAVEIPRINHGGGLNVTVEPGIDEGVLTQLEAWGHVLRRRTTRGGVGGAQGIMFNALTGVMTGGSTPHKDGMAVAR